MNPMYANQITVTVGETEVLLRFAHIMPQYDIDGKLKESTVANEQTIVLSPAAFAKMREVIDSMPGKDKE